MTIDDALARFLVQLEADGRSSAHHRPVPPARPPPRRVVRPRWPQWRGGGPKPRGHRPVSLLATGANTERRKGQEGGVVNVLRGTVKGFFAYLHRAGYIAEDPTRLTRRALCAAPFQPIRVVSRYLRLRNRCRRSLAVSPTLSRERRGRFAGILGSEQERTPVGQLLVVPKTTGGTRRR